MNLGAGVHGSDKLDLRVERVHSAACLVTLNIDNVDLSCGTSTVASKEVVEKRKDDYPVWKAGQHHRHAKQKRTLKASEWDTSQVSLWSNDPSLDGIEYFQAEHPGL